MYLKIGGLPAVGSAHLVSLFFSFVGPEQEIAMTLVLYAFSPSSLAIV